MADRDQDSGTVEYRRLSGYSGTTTTVTSCDATISTSRRYMHLDDRELAEAQDLIE